MSLIQHISLQISKQTKTHFHPQEKQTISGGCINHAMHLSDGRQDWFVKTNSADKLSMFEAEAEGLNAMAATQSILVPKSLCTGADETQSFIVINYIENGSQNSNSQALAGQQLAEMHKHVSQQFGWHRNNTIGATYQNNTWTNSWIDFWREHRLGYQLKLAAINSYGGRLQQTGDQLLSRFHTLIDHAPQASLLHGDLWGGNISFNQAGDPVIFDPACYYGDREADIAMTELFGGFSTDFYAAYNNTWPLDSGYKTRKSLYNLYHILNHLNLFGEGYAHQAQNLIDNLLSDC